MPEQHITVQEYQFHRALCEFPEVADEHLCVGRPSHFIAALLAIAALAVGYAAWTVHLIGGTDDVVFRRHAEVRSLASAGWER